MNTQQVPQKASRTRADYGGCSQGVREVGAVVRDGLLATQIPTGVVHVGATG